MLSDSQSVCFPHPAPKPLITLIKGLAPLLSGLAEMGSDPTTQAIPHSSRQPNPL